MNSLLLKLLGVPAEQARHIAGHSLSFHGYSLAWIIFFAIILAAAVIWMYQMAAEQISPIRRYTLAALRAVFLLLILLLMARPVLAFTIEQTIRKSLVLLIDVSKSMNIEDRRTDRDDQVRIGIAKGELDPTKGVKQELDEKQRAAYSQVPRLQVLKAVLKNQKLDLLAHLAKEYDLSIFTFDRTTAEAAGANSSASRDKWIEQLTAKGADTAIGDGVSDVTSKKRGQPLAGILLITDGGSNSGSDALQAAKQAKRDGVAIHTYGVGIASPRDIIVESIFAPEVAFTKDELPVEVHVRSQNLAGESAQLVLKLEDGTTVDERHIEFGGDSSQKITMKFKPSEKPGKHTLTAEIAPRDDETVKDNNSKSQPVRVVDDKIKVLLVEQSPRWEYKYLSAMLARDTRVNFHTVLFEGDKNLAHGENSPFLEEFPTKDEDLFKYDLLILGDVDPKLFSASQMDAIFRFVSDIGGAMVFVAGRKSNPNAYTGTPLAKLLPVDLMPGAGDVGAQGVADKAVKMKITLSGRSNAMLRIADKEQESMELWNRLPPVYWTARVLRARPGAEVLMVDPDDTKKYQGKEEMPIMAMQQYKLGQTLFLGTDNTWRWRKNAGDKYYTTLWGQIVYRMALPHLMSGSKTTQFPTNNKQKYAAGERITVYARLYTPTFQPWTAENGHPVVKGIYRKVGQSDQLTSDHDVALKAVEGQPGMYSGEFAVADPGAYELHIAEREKEATFVFQVVEPLNEYDQSTAMDEQLLKDMSAASGGTFFREEDLYKIPETLGPGTDYRYTKYEVELGSTWIYFGLLMAVVTAEWIMRKMSQLK